MSDSVGNQKLDPSNGEPLRGGAYDGIQEYDNPPPMWLQAIFYATVAWSVLYIPYYLNGYATDTDHPPVNVMAEYKALKQQQADWDAKNRPKDLDDAGFVALSQDANAVAAGKAQFVATCVACHGPEGQGVVGPNLADNAWIHGGTPTEIHKVIVNGVLDKGMIAWSASLKPDVINNLVAYIMTLKGTNPPNPKPPQGTVVE